MNNKTSLELVKEFHEKFGHPVEDKPDLSNYKLFHLRYELFNEELIEFVNGCYRENKIEVLDALCDLQVVLDGAFLALGFWKVKDAAIAEVMRSNMSKLGADGKPIYRHDGKILKGPNYTPPNLKQFITNES